MNYEIKTESFNNIKGLNSFLQQEKIEYDDIVNIVPAYPHSTLVYRVRVEEEIQKKSDNIKPDVFDSFPKYIQIILNGNPFLVSKNVLTYFEIVAYARKDGNPTVAYRDIDGRHKVLRPESSIIVHSGMIINCVHTGNA